MGYVIRRYSSLGQLGDGRLEVLLGLDRQHVALLVHDELAREVPRNVAQHALLFEVLVRGSGVGAVDVGLGEHVGPFDAFQRAKGGHLGVAARLLGTKLPSTRCKRCQGSK